jgi:hypothetical protein
MLRRALVALAAWALAAAVSAGVPRLPPTAALPAQIAGRLLPAPFTISGAGPTIYAPAGWMAAPDVWMGQNSGFPTSGAGSIVNSTKGFIHVELYGTWDNDLNLYSMYNSGTLITNPWTTFTGSIDGCQNTTSPNTCVLTVQPLAATTGLPASMAAGVSGNVGDPGPIRRGQWIVAFTGHGGGSNGLHPQTSDFLYVDYSAADGGAYCDGSACTGNGGPGTYAVCIGSGVSFGQCATMSSAFISSVGAGWENIPMWASGGCEVNANGYNAPGFCWSADNNYFQLNMNNAAGAVASTDKFDPTALGIGPLVHSGAWTDIAASWDTVNGLCAIAINGVNTNNTAYPPGAVGCPQLVNSLIVDLNDPTGFGLNAQYPTWEGFQGFMFKEGVYAGCTSSSQTTFGGYNVTCTGANLFPPEFLAKIYSTTGGYSGAGGPVDPGADCSTPFGNLGAPELCYKFASAATETTNAGSATASFGIYSDALASLPIVGNSASQVPTMTPPYGPAGIPPHQPTMRWAVANNSRFNLTMSAGSFKTNVGQVGVPCTATGSTSNCAPISVGDLLVIWALDTRTGADVVSCPAGWKGGPANWDGQGAPGTVVSDTYEGMYVAECWHVATSADVVVSNGSPGMPGTQNGEYVIPCGACTTSTTGAFVLMDFGSVNATDPVDLAATGVGAATVTTGGTSWPTASGATSVANETVVQCAAYWSVDYHGNIITPPGGYNWRWYTTLGNGSSTYPQIMCVDMYSAPAGFNPSKTPGGAANPWTQSFSDSLATLTLSLKPN